MPRPRVTPRLTAGRAITVAAAAALAATSSIAPGGVRAAAAEIVYENGFESEADGWYPFGGPTVERTDTAAHSGSFSLVATDRTQGFEGPALGLNSLLEPDTTYEFSAWVMTPEAATIGWTMKTTFDGADDGFSGFASADAPAGTWTEIGGSFTTAADGIGFDAYFESGETASGFVDIHVDDVAIAGPDGEPVFAFASDFDDGTTQGWYGRGDAQVAASTDVSHSSDHSLAVTGRADTWQGPGADVTDALDAGAEYAFSAWVHLPAGAEASGFNLAMVRTVDGEQNFEWISGFVDGVAGDWVELAGNYVFDEADSLELYVEADTLTDFSLDDVTVEQLSLPPGPVGVVLATDFEDGLGDWQVRTADETPATVSLNSDAHGGAQAALVSDRDGQGDGIGHVVTDVMPQGGNYHIEAWLKMAEGSGDGDIWLTMQRTNDGTDTFDTVGQFAGVGAGEWVYVEATYRMPAADTAFLYFETDYPDGTADPFLVDDIVITGLEDAEIEDDLTPIKDTLDPAMGVAVDSRETTGPAAQLVDLHFDQMTPENHMKPEAWYDADGNFQVHPETVAIMDFATANDLDVYGHVLVWHSQTPDWFFQDDTGRELTADPADQEFLRQRMRDHIYNVAEALSAWGEYGGDNPLNAWDVVNEVISDGATDDGLRRSRWYDILGEEYIDLAFQYANEAFNDVYAADGADHPVLLAINDYNTEQTAKRTRMKALTERLLDRGAPVDIFGHQFHLNLSVPVQALDDALADIEPLGLQQVVSELDVTTGTPVTEALLIDQGYYYRDAFEIFRSYTDMHAITVWGLTDNRSWRADAGDPLVFDADYQAKPAYYGIVGDELPAQQRTAFVFQPNESDHDVAASSAVWERLPLHPVGGDAGFQLRWSGDELIAFVEVADATADPGDEVAFVFDDATFTVGRDGSGDVDPLDVVETDTGWAAVASLPITGAAEGDTLGFDVQVTIGDEISAWNSPGTLGTLSLIEPLSYTEATEASTAPAIDGAIDDAWGDAAAVTTGKVVTGTADGASAEVRTLWAGDTLYVLAEVADATPDVSGSDPWVQDSVEIFLDAGNAKNGPYRSDDTQIRISMENVTSFGTGDPAFQADRLESATSTVEGGYVVEAAISLLEYGGPGTFHGLDFQVNDGSEGSRISVRTWGEPTGTGYQTTARWGVVRLAEPAIDCDADGTTCVGPGESISGGISVGEGETLSVDGAELVGPIRIAGAAEVHIVGSVTEGPLSITGVAGEVDLTDNTVTGPVRINGAADVSLVGNEFTGPVAITGTTGDVGVIDNTIDGPVDIDDNAGPIVLGGNTIMARLFCAGNAMVPTDGGSANVVHGPAKGQCADLT